MESVLEIEVIKANLRKLAKEDPEFVRGLILEINEETKKIKSELLQKIVQDDFDRYAEVFKALA